MIDRQEMLKDAIAVSPRLAATKTCIEKALMSLVVSDSKKFPIAVSERDSWVTTQLRRTG